MTLDPSNQDAVVGHDGADTASALKRIELGDGWRLCGIDGYGETLGEAKLPAVLNNAVWIDANVSGSVYADLTRAGWIGDVHQGFNSLSAQWVESHFWYYCIRFARPSIESSDRCMLVLDGVDLDAAIFLNGELIARHANAFRPCRVDVTGLLADGENELTIRVESGLLAAADKPGGRYNLEVLAAITKRAYLRKPQYTCRWDWAPRLMSVGVGGGVWLEVGRTVRLAYVVALPHVADDLQSAEIEMRAFVENWTEKPQRLTLTAKVDGRASSTEFDAPPGESRIDLRIPIDNPKLWWPRGWGEQALYNVNVALESNGVMLDTAQRNVGLRSVRLDQPPAADEGRLFHIVVNNQPVFCKGANWVPADILYQTVTADDYQALVDLAVEANFNLLRVWGGGLYESDVLLDACDRAGLMVWHDLPFACSKFPGDDPAFRNEVLAEVTHNVRLRAHHASLILWCGNNENELGVQDGWIKSHELDSTPCRSMFFDDFAKLFEREDPTRPYWPSSPWSGGGEHPNARHLGDQHPWDVGLGPPRGDYRQYLQDASRFPNEGGMLGPSTLKTLHEILPPGERRVGSRLWMHHDNPQNNMTVTPLVDHLLQVNLCPDPRGLDFDDYVRYGGILHGEALATGIDNWRRRKFDSAAAVFWMFNDTWPAATSWTPIDFARRRKPAFWYVKRSFADVRAVCVEQKDECVVYLVNDRLTPVEVTLRFGLFRIGGGLPMDETVQIAVGANSAMAAVRFPLAQWVDAGELDCGAFAMVSEGNRAISTHRLFRRTFRELNWTPADVRVTRMKDSLQLSSDQFAWAVCLDADGETPLADNYFDLIPGVDREFAWPVDWPTPANVAATNPPSSVTETD